MMRGKKESLASWKRRLARRSEKMHRRPGGSWRVLAWERNRQMNVGSQIPPCLREDRARYVKRGATGTVVDEVVIDDWLHLEQMDTRVWWLAVGNHVLWIEVPTTGPVKVGHRVEADRT